MKQIYLDNHSATRVDDRVLEAMLPYFKEDYGNAQSMHNLGNRAKETLEKARNQVAGLVNARPEEIYFTSCGSESNNLAIKGIAQAYGDKGRHIIVSSIEHFSVLHAARRLDKQGYEITYLPVDKYGFVSIDDVKGAIRKDTILVSIHHANPEIGTIEPIEEIGKILREKNIIFHTDAIATCGHISVDLNKLNVDLLSLASSQFYGPKGTAALYIKKGVRIVPQIDGGIQENGRRAGTENIPAIVGMGMACEIAKQEIGDNYKKIIRLRDRLIKELPTKIEYFYLNGHPEKRLPNNVNFSVEFIEGEGLLLLLNEKGIYVSSASACASKALKMSHVLTSIKVDAAVGQGTILMTLSKYNSDEDIDYVLTEFPPVAKKLRDLSPIYAYFLKTGKRQEAGPGTDYEHMHEHSNNRSE